MSASTSRSTSNVSDEVEVIVSGIRDMYDAYLAQDRVRFDRHLAADATTWESHLPRLFDRHELDSYRDRRTPADLPAIDDLQVTVHRVDVWGGVAVARYLLHAVVANRTPETTRITDVLTRDEAGWRIAHHHAEARRVPDEARPDEAPLHQARSEECP
ncbi:DUF4440 domain-containing protein [Nocardioides sp. LHD-245]|uniref:DUF4440 domain-containing protein n=1 Tax=Nocardioides sp. LHD-245 TaxID=3051387 RepID=UPI0027E0187D|nr:DUF4440 domain-containing protein [Nocardioides sp. LHD-245]